jgi:ATP-dependent DNA ligase
MDPSSTGRIRGGARCSTGSSCTARVVRGAPTHGSVADVLKACAEHNLDGIVAKRVDSPYRPGERSSDWLKLKTADWRATHASQRHPR